MRRRSGTWMTIWDDRILEYLRDCGPASVGELESAETVRISNAHVSRRCKKLSEHGLLQPVGNGVYQITERGNRYLKGEISTFEDEFDEIPEKDDDRAAGESGIQP